MSPYSSARRSAAAPSTKTLATHIVCLLVLALLCLSVASLWAQAPTPVPVPTWRYDLTHAGQNTSETALTLANVNVNSFGKLFSLNVDSTVYPQPLYIPGLTLNGAVHNVVFIATSNDSIYAFDADSNGGANAKPLWQVSLLTKAHGAGAGATAIPWEDTASPDVAPTIGITGTPTIDPATNTMYVVGATKENGAYFSRLHAINILTGAEQPNSPVVISATVAGTGHGSSGGKLSFSPLWQNQRSALNLYNGYVYFGYGAHGDNGPWHGWIFSYNATTLAQAAALCLSANGYGAGVWESGAGMPIDTDAAGGRMFVATGNGTFTTYPPFTANTGFSEGVFDFSLANGGLTPTDGFTSFNAQILNNSDLDQGAGGLLMVPDQQGTYPHELVNAGKEGRILVLNRDKLGGFAGADEGSNTNIPQDIPGEIKGLWSTPAYWNGNVYTWGNGDVPKLFRMNSGVLSSEPSSKSSITSAFPGASFSISSNGAQDGIAWAERTDQFNSHGAAVLYAWDATDLTKTIYESDTNSKRDAGGPANRYSIPMVTNGKVYIVANGQVDVYGLFNNEPAAAAPTISPNGGTFNASQSVTLATTTASASIYYTLDGMVPTPASTLYTEPITISTDTTVHAIASAVGFVQSAVSSAIFTFSNQTPAANFLPAAGTYTSAQQITLSDTDAAAKIYYTTNGTAPTAASTLYTGPITVAATETINAIAIDPALVNSNVATAAYVIQTGTTINFGTGFSNTTGLTLNGSTLATNDTRLQLTNGGLDEAGSVFWNQPINIQSFTTSFEFQLSLAQANGFTFTVQNNAPTALGGGYSGLGYSGIGKSVAIKFDFYNSAGEGNDSTGVYTDGALPTVPAVDLTPSGIELNSDDSIVATVTYDGTTLTLNLLDLVTNKTFTTSKAINIPQVVGGNTAYVGFTGGTGGLSASQKLLTWTYTTPLSAATPAATTTSLSASATQITAGQSVTFNAAVIASAGAIIPSGTITLLDGATSLGTASLANGAATFNVTTLPVGAQSITASYAGNSTDAASTSSPLVIQVNSSVQQATATTLVASAATAPAGQAVTLTATVAPTSGSSSPSGTVTFHDGATAIGTATLAAGKGSLSISTLSVGSHTITAVYGGDAGDTGSTSSAVTVAITAALPADYSLTLSAGTVAATQAAPGTLTATVTPENGFAASVAFACSGLPSGWGCTFAPATLSGGTTQTTTLTVGPTTSSALAPRSTGLMLAFASPLAFFFLRFGGGRLWKTRFVVLAAFTLFLVGCGGGSPSNGGSGGSQPAKYTVTLTASGTSAPTHTQTFVATITQ